MVVDPTSPETDYYAVLGLPIDAQAADITRAYRRLARERHPDVSDDLRAGVGFAAIAEAHAVLSDPVKRAAYDRSRRRATAADGSGTRYRIRVDNLDNPGGGAVHDDPPRPFGRSGDDLTLDVPVTYAEAVLGADVRVPTLDGAPVTLRVPAGIQSGRVLRVPRRGLRTEGRGRVGDLLVTVHVAIPRQLTDTHRSLVEQLRAHDPTDLRAHLEAAHR